MKPAAPVISVSSPDAKVLPFRMRHCVRFSLSSSVPRSTGLRRMHLGLYPRTESSSMESLAAVTTHTSQPSLSLRISRSRPCRCHRAASGRARRTRTLRRSRRPRAVMAFETEPTTSTSGRTLENARHRARAGRVILDEQDTRLHARCADEPIPDVAGRVVRWRVATTSGSTKVNRLPVPTAVSTRISPPQLTRQPPGDGQAHSESLFGVSFIVLHLKEFVE